MKNITKVGLSALAGALAMTSANAGDLSLSGSMEVTWTTGSGYQDTGNNFGQENEMDITASTELDNGTSVAYKRSLTALQAGSDSELVFTGLPFTAGGTLAMTSTGSPISAIDDVTPTAFEEANAQVGSVDDVNGMDGTFGIRYTLADVAGTGITLDAMYTPVHGAGDTAADQSTATAHGNDTGTEVVIKGAVPMVDGLNFGVGYALLEKQDAADTGSAVGESSVDQEEGTAYLTYAYGPLTLGVQKGAVVQGLTNTQYVNDIYGISYSISDDLSVSYNVMEAARTATDGLRTEQEFDSISIGYTMGGMSIKLADADCSKCSYTHSGRNQDETTISLSVAF